MDVICNITSVQSIGGWPNAATSPKHYEELYLNGMQTYSPVINPERPAAMYKPAAAIRTALNPKETDNVIARTAPITEAHPLIPHAHGT